jgi:hypothetical protein
MPGLRYGPDFTDEAEATRKSYVEAKSIKNPNKAQQRRLADLRRQVRGYGGEKAMNEFAKYSLAQQGYSKSGKAKDVGNIRYKPRPSIPKELLAKRGNKPTRSATIGSLLGGKEKRTGTVDLATGKFTPTKKAAKKAAKKPAKKAKKAAKKAPAKRAKKAAKRAR